MENKKHYSWIVPKHVDVSFKTIYGEYKYQVIVKGKNRNEAITYAINDFMSEFCDTEYNDLPYEVKLKIEIDFRAWLAENGK